MKRDRDVHMALVNAETNLTRSSVSQRAAWITAAVAFPRVPGYGAVMAAQDVSPVMVKLSTYMADARNSELPEKVVQNANYHILDTVAAMISGSELPPDRHAIQFARTYGSGQKRSSRK